MNKEIVDCGAPGEARSLFKSINQEKMISKKVQQDLQKAAEIALVKRLKNWKVKIDKNDFICPETKKYTDLESCESSNFGLGCKLKNICTAYKKAKKKNENQSNNSRKLP